MAVAKRLAEPGSGLPAERIRALTSGQDDARAVINALFERPYRVVHVAGHGCEGADGGVVLSGKNTYLGANEVFAMRVVPELVFLNCCHLAGRDAATTLNTTYDRAGFAANIAEALIKVGVRCVIAAGWAVDDGPAETFATTFYASLLGGARFIEAVSAARNAAWRDDPRGNTWAAYQCYGDPEWTWQRHGSDITRKAQPLSEQYAAVASPMALTLALETLAVNSEYSTTQRQPLLDKLRFLDSQFAPLWGGMGAVAEAFGLAYAGARDLDKAIAWYQRAVDAADGTASFKAAEQLGNWLVRRAAQFADVDAARKDIQQGIRQLERLVAVQSTAERHNLLGSASKRLSMLEDKAQRSKEAAAALGAAARHYAAAEELARKSGAADLFYPAKACIGCELRRAFIDHKPFTIAETRMNEVRRSMLKAATEKPDFWSVVGLTELSLLAALAAGKLAAQAPALIENFRALKARVPAAGKWDSVHNEALFTLEPYMAHSSGAEKRAATDVLAALKLLAAN